MTPLYDILSAWPVIGRGNNKIAWQKCKLAMAIRGSSNYYLISKIQRRHWIKQGEQSGLGKRQIETMIDEIIELTLAVIENVARQLPESFPAELADAIFTGMEQQRVRLKAQT